MNRRIQYFICLVFFALAWPCVSPSTEKDPLLKALAPISPFTRPEGTENLSLDQWTATEILPLSSADFDSTMGFRAHEIPVSAVKNSPIIISLLDTPLEDYNKIYVRTFAGKPYQLVYSSPTGRTLKVKPLLKNLRQYWQLVDDFKFLTKERRTSLEKRLVIGITEIGKRDIKIGGGKGSSLGELSKIVDVPEGFTVTTAALRLFFDRNPRIRERVQQLLDTVDATNNTAREQVASEIQGLIRSGQIPEKISSNIRRYYKILNRWMRWTRQGIAAREGRLAVAARSSGVFEDISEKISWFKHTSGAQAGIGETALNVRGVDALLTEIKDTVWASLFTDRSIAYRDDQLFLSFAAEIGESNYKDMVQATENAGYSSEAAELKDHNSIGYHRLLRLLRQIGRDAAGDLLEAKGREFGSLDTLTQAVPVLRQLNSYVAGTAFSAIANTGFTGKARIRMQKKSREAGDTTIPLLEGETTVLQIDAAWRQGEGIVGGLTTADSYMLHTVDGRHWNIIESTLGAKATQIVIKEDAYRAIPWEQEKIQEFLQKLTQALTEKGGSKTRSQMLAELLGDPALVMPFYRMLKLSWQNENPFHVKYSKDVLQKLDLDAFRFQCLVNLAHPHWIHKGTVQIPTPENLRSKFVLSDENLQLIARTLKKIADHYGDPRDIEFAFEVDMTGKLKLFTTDLFFVNGDRLGEAGLRPYGLQARPLTSKTQDDRKHVEIDNRITDGSFIKQHNLRPIAKGVKGISAATGIIFVVDDKKPLGPQADEIIRLRLSDQNIIALIKFATPAHDPIMKAANATITYEGGDTSHAAIFNREQGIPAVTGIGKPDEKLARLLQHGKAVTVDANNGLIYEGDEVPVLPENITIKWQYLPRLVHKKIGLILAGTRLGQLVSGLSEYDSHYGNSLARLEFIIQKVGIYPLAAEAYDNHRALERNEKLELTPAQLDAVQKLRAHPEEIKKIEEKILGYPDAKTYVVEVVKQGISNLSAALGPHQWNVVRAYDNKPNEVEDLAGAAAFVSHGRAPLIDLRGASLETRDENRIAFSYLLQGILQAVKSGYQNTGFMNVFIRTPRELSLLLKNLEDTIKIVGAIPLNVGIMIEVPSNAVKTAEFAELLKDFYDKHPEIKIFFSFGTNDLTNLSGKTDRDDPSVQNLEIRDPAVNTIELKDGTRFRRDANGKLVIPLADEGSPLIAQIIESVVSHAQDHGISTGLCGQAIVKLIERGNFDEAAKIISYLDSFGTDVKNYVSTVMTAFDAESALAYVDEEKPSDPLLHLTKVTQEGALTGEVVFVDGPQDLVAKHPTKERPVAGKIVIVRSKLGTKEELEKANVDWDDLRYARAIIIDQRVGFNLEDLTGDILSVQPELRHRIKTYARIEHQVQNGDAVTLDLTQRRMYKGLRPLSYRQVSAKKIDFPVPAEEPRGHDVQIASADEVFQRQNFHPLMIQRWMESEQIVRDREDVELIAALEAEIGKPGDVVAYYKEIFKAKMLEALTQANGEPLLWRLTTMARDELAQLRGGNIIESLNENPPYGLLDAARNISDFWQIHRAQLKAIKELRDEGHKNLYIEITNLRGTRSRELLNANLQILRQEELVPDPEGDRLQVGINIQSLIDILALEDYIDMGITYVRIDEEALAQGLLAIAPDREDIVQPEEMEEILRDPIHKIKSILAQAQSEGKNITLVYGAHQELKLPRPGIEYLDDLRRAYEVGDIAA